MENLGTKRQGAPADDEHGNPTGTFDWSMVGFLAAMVVIAVVLGYFFT